jgi:hypothetical protein
MRFGENTGLIRTKGKSIWGIIDDAPDLSSQDMTRHASQLRSAVECGEVQFGGFHKVLGKLGSSGGTRTYNPSG